MRGELEAEQNCNILTPTLMAITVFLSHSPGLLNWGPGGPASLGHVPHSSIFSPTNLNFNCSIRGLRAPSAGCWFPLPHLISNCLTSCLHPGYIIVQRPLSSCGHHKSHSIQPVDGQGYILIFLDQMHLLFTQVHFLFWQLGRGQCYMQTPTKLFDCNLDWEIVLFSSFKHFMCICVIKILMYVLVYNYSIKE